MRSGAATARGHKPRLDELFHRDSSEGQLSGPSSAEGHRSGPQSAENSSDDTERSEGKTRVKGHHRGRSVPNKAGLMQAKKGNCTMPIDTL